MRTAMLLGLPVLACASPPVSPPDAAIADAAAGRDQIPPDAAGPGVQSFERPCGSFRLRITVLDDAVVRFHYLHRSEEQPERGWFLDLSGFSGPSALAIDDTPARLHLTTAALAVEVAGPACAVTIQDRQSNVLWDDGGAFTADQASGAVQISRALRPGERLYGLGEKTGASDRRGRRLTLWSSDPVWTDPRGRYAPDTDPLYQSHPFLLSLDGGRATGSFLFNTFRSFFDLGATASDRLSLGAEGGDLDHFFFFGPAPVDVIERYTRVTGRLPLPPLWTLGYHQSRWSYAPASRLEDVANQFRQRGLPCDGLWLDIDYMRGFRSFTWDPTGFPDPAALVARLEAAGFKLTAIIDPGIKRDPGAGYAVYDDGVSGHHFARAADGTPFVGTVWPGDALFPDFTRAATRGFWGAHVAGLADIGVRGLWIDMNEPTSWTPTGIPLDVRFDGDGLAATHAEVHNAYALLMARATYEGALARWPDRRPFVLTRAGFAGIQRWAAVWTGDVESTWEHLALVPAMLAGLGVSGVPFVGSDVGGFSGGPSRELFGRWFELGAFSPFFRTHVATGTPAQEPWAFGAEVEALAQRALALRYRLLPYLYTAFEEAARLGTPILRPLWLAHPSDDGAAGHDDEFFFGPALLFAPVLTPQVTTRPVYLPPGVFYDFYGGAAVVGPTTIQASAPLGRSPLYVRAGSVVPMQDPLHYVGEMPLATLYLDVFPGPPGTAGASALYEDDGATLGYQRGLFARTPIALTTDPAGVTIDLGPRAGAFVPPPRAIELRIHGLAESPTGATVDGAAADLSYDPGTRTARLRLADGAAARRLVVRYDAATLPAARTVQVSLQVALPPATPPGPIYVATSARAWDPAGLALTRSPDGTRASGQLAVPEGALVLYKYTRGTWPTVEVDGGSCGELPNRQLEAVWGESGSLARSDTATAWRDRCP